MEHLFKKIQDSKHIVLVLLKDSSVNDISFCSAIYTYILQLNKRVSFYCDENIFEKNIVFLPWLDKIRTSYPLSNDLVIEPGCSYALFKFFKDKEIKINKKMATSLYAGILDYTDGFKKNINSEIFEAAKILNDFKADVEMCTNNILNYQALSFLRLKSIFLSKLVLKDNAQIVHVDLDEDDLKKSGANSDKFKDLAKEALSLPTVNVVKIVYKNNILEYRS